MLYDEYKKILNESIKRNNFRNNQGGNDNQPLSPSSQVSVSNKDLSNLIYDTRKSYELRKSLLAVS